MEAPTHTRFFPSWDFLAKHLIPIVSPILGPGLPSIRISFVSKSLSLSLSCPRGKVGGLEREREREDLRSYEASPLTTYSNYWHQMYSEMVDVQLREKREEEDWMPKKAFFKKSRRNKTKAG